MNPIKTHLLDRLRPKDRTMRNNVDLDAYQLGKRACRAGMEPRRGIFTIGEDATVGFYDAGVITGFGHNEKIETSEGYLLSWGGELVPDFRDPGTKGHAVAQLREKYNDPGAYVAFDYVDGNECTRDGWTLVLDCVRDDDIVSRSTEEEAIVAAFEAIKESP